MVGTFITIWPKVGIMYQYASFGNAQLVTVPTYLFMILTPLL
jgi:hypothetical protein